MNDDEKAKKLAQVIAEALRQMPPDDRVKVARMLCLDTNAEVVDRGAKPPPSGDP